MKLEIKVEFPAGADIKDCADAMIKMAIRLDVLIFGYFNGVHVFATENTHPDSIINMYHKSLGENKAKPKVIWVNESSGGNYYPHRSKESAMAMSEGSDEGWRKAIKYIEVIDEAN